MLAKLSVLVCVSRPLLLVLFYRMRVFMYNFSSTYHFQILMPPTNSSSLPATSLTDEDLSLLRSLVLVSFRLYLFYLLSCVCPSLSYPFTSLMYSAWLAPFFHWLCFLTLAPFSFFFFPDAEPSCDGLYRAFTPSGYWLVRT